MDFSDALFQVKKGLKVARKGWNGKGQYICLFSPKINEIKPYIAIRTVQGYYVPWNASQSDLLATDWLQVDIAPCDLRTIPIQDIVLQQITAKFAFPLLEADRYYQMIKLLLLELVEKEGLNLIDYIEDRKQCGLSEYGTYLYAGNGSSSHDCIEELADALFYRTQYLIEKDDEQKEKK